MSEPGAYKCSCKNCDEHLAYPTDWEGAEIKCPHCSKDTLLEQAAEQLAEAAKKAAEAAEGIQPRSLPHPLKPKP
jgi:DNA-directed RNA polymerase subunit RPC12/RpoP